MTSILLQSLLPDRINLWVSRDAYLRDQGISDQESIDVLFKSLPESSTNVVCIRWVDNTGPYRKLIPALREAGPDDLIVTADDDIFYGRDWLQGLIEAYDPAEGVPSASRVRRIRTNFIGKLTSYIYWTLYEEASVIREDYVVTFGGGVVLARSMFREDDIFDESFLTIAPTADDLWYSKLLSRNGTPVRVIPRLLSELHFVQHNDGLTNHNFPKVSTFIHKIRVRVWDQVVGFFGYPVCGNDIAFRKIERYFSS